MFSAVHDPDARRVAVELTTEIGSRADDAGGLGNETPLEEMVKVWLALSQAHGRRIGFALSDR